MKPRAQASGVVAIALVLAACSYQPSMQHPKLPALAPTDTTMDCRQIDAAIDRADTVRWLIRDDGGRLETSNHRAARYTANFILVPLSVLAMSPAYMPDGGHAVLDAADSRIRELLQFKRDRDCPQRATALPELDDLALLGELEAVKADFGAGRVDEEQMLKQRTRLLDGLRLVPVAGGDSSQTARGRDGEN